MASQRITLTIPQGLYDQLMRLVEAGYYESVSEALRSGLRRELSQANLAAPSISLSTDDQAYLRQLADIRQLIAGSERRQESKQEVLDELRRTRDDIWREGHSAPA